MIAYSIIMFVTAGLIVLYGMRWTVSDDIPA